MPKPLVIGFLGRAGSGKSTAATYAIGTWGGQRFSFATPLKELAKILYEFTDEQVYGPIAIKEATDPRWGISPRTGMIRLGDGARNTMGKRVWVDACFAKILETHEAIKQAGTTPPVYIIDDVRYPNEVAAIRADSRFKGYIIKLVCPDSDSTSFSDAPSEKSVDEVADDQIDFHIISHKSPNSVDLKGKVDAVLADIVERHRE